MGGGGGGGSTPAAFLPPSTGRGQRPEANRAAESETVVVGRSERLGISVEDWREALGM